MPLDLSTPPSVDIDALLQPIREDQPAGRSLIYEAEYDQIREARRSEEDIPQGAWTRDTKVADWDGVVDLAVACLTTKTKDLQIAAWLTEALTRLHGFAGLRDGMRVLLGIQEGYWDSYYPQVEDGDLDSRVGPFLFLNQANTLIRILRTIPLTTGEETYDLNQHIESRETENLIRKNPDDEKKILAGGRIRADRFDRAVVASPRRFYERIVADLHAAKVAFDAFDKSTDEHFGRDAPSLMDLRKTIDECLRLLDPILAQKRQSEPDSELDAPPEPEPGVEETNALDEAGGSGEAEGSTSSVVARAATGMDFGTLLIEFHQRAEELASAGVKLKENRQRHAELLEQVRALDVEYEEISRQVSRNREFYDLLQKLLRSGRAG
jgi:type VI secretion system protein ImpA